MDKIIYVRSVVTDGSGHSIVDADCMPEEEFENILHMLSQIYNGIFVVGGIAGHERYTFSQVLSDGRRVSDMLIASEVA